MSYLNPHTHDLDSPEGVAKLVADIGAMGHTADVLDEIAAERQRQDAKWGQQNHPDGTGDGFARDVALAKFRCQRAARRGEVTWQHILDEEVAETYAESDTARLRAELVQVAAVAVAWVEAIDRRPIEGAEESA